MPEFGSLLRLKNARSESIHGRSIGWVTCGFNRRSIITTRSKLIVHGDQADRQTGSQAARRLGLAPATESEAQFVVAVRVVR